MSSFNICVVEEIVAPSSAYLSSLSWILMLPPNFVVRSAVEGSSCPSPVFPVKSFMKFK